MSLAIVITGASRGLGRALALVAAQTSFHPSVKHLQLFLVARSASGLQETAKLVEATEFPQEQTQCKLSVSCHAMDLADLDKLDTNLDTLCQSLDDVDETSCNGFILINNAGSIGHLGPTIDSPSLQDMRTAVDLNVTSCFWTSVRLARYARGRKLDDKTTLVNISSLVAVADFATFGIYSAGKAARDKYHSLITQETPAIRTLNYAPGPLETDMVDEIRNAEELNADLKPNFKSSQLNPADSARKLMQLLKSNDFTSGAHVDYFDLPDASA